MHLVYKALEKYAIPNVLPPELMPPGKRKDVPLAVDPPASIMSISPTIPPMPAVGHLVGLESVKVCHMI